MPVAPPRTGRGAKVERWGAVLLLGLLMVLLAGCEVLRLERPLAADPDAWTTEGGTAARASAQDVDLALPLAERWVYNAEAAFGPAAALARDGRLFVTTRQGEVRVLALNDERTALGITELGDAIEGAPVLTDRALYAPIAQGGDGVVAYDFVRGERIWRLDAEHHAAGLLLAEDTPSGPTLVAASLTGTVRALNPATGEARWETAPDSAHAVHATPGRLDAETVAVADDRGRVTAYTLADGSVQWTAEVGAPVYATPAVARGLLLVPTTRGRLVALDAGTGRVRWTHAAATPTTRLTAPATDGRTVFVGASDGTLAALDAATGAECWTHTEDGVLAAAPHLAGDTVVVGTLRKRVLALDAATGTVRWQTEIEGRVKTAPLVADGYLVVLAEPRQVYLFGPADSLAAR